MPKKQKKDESRPDEAELEAKAIVDEVFANAVHISDRRSKATKKDIQTSGFVVGIFKNGIHCVNCATWWTTAMGCHA